MTDAGPPEPQAPTKPLPVRSRAATWLNRIRTRFPIIFGLLVLILAPPRGSWWGLAAVALGQGLRLWAAGWLRKDSVLTTGGPFAYVRNPLYLGTLLSAGGLLVIVGDWRWAAGFAAAFALLYALTIREEEAYLSQVHGAAYLEYRKQVPRLLPSPGAARAGPWPRIREQGRFDWGLLRHNKEHLNLLAVIILLALLWLRQRFGIWR